MLKRLYLEGTIDNFHIILKDNTSYKIINMFQNTLDMYKIKYDMLDDYEYLLFNVSSIKINKIYKNFKEYFNVIKYKTPVGSIPYKE